MRVLLRSPMNPFTGYGRDGIGLAMALIRWGIDVHLDPEYLKPPIPHQVAKLLTKEVQPPFDLVIQHTDPDNLVALEKSDQVTAQLAWTMWEYTSLANSERHATLAERCADFDAVVAYDPVAARAFEEVVEPPVHVLQGGYASEDWKPIVRDWHSPTFRFLMVGHLTERKAPFVAMEAFRELADEHEDFAEHARLVLKTTAPGLHPALEQWIPGLRVLQGVHTAPEMRALYGLSHVLLAPSRGEGKNLPALEMLATGGTVIATNWGGHTGWLSRSMAYPVGAELIDVPEGNGAQWADPDRAQLKAAMLDAFRDRAGARRRGETAERTIEASCSWDAVVRRLVTNLPKYLPDGRGRSLQALAEASHRAVSFEPKFERTRQ